MSRICSNSLKTPAKNLSYVTFSNCVPQRLLYARIMSFMQVVGLELSKFTPQPVIQNVTSHKIVLMKMR